MFRSVLGMTGRVIEMFIIFALILNGLLFVSSHDNGHGKVLLYLLDGLRWDLYGLDLPELRKVEEYGVRAEWMDGVFVTLSTPSAFSMATGVYVFDYIKEYKRLVVAMPYFWR